MCNVGIMEKKGAMSHGDKGCYRRIKKEKWFVTG